MATEKDFLEMINQNRGTLFKVCGLYEATEEDKKDLFQEIILQLWRAYPSFNSDSKSNTWLYRVALNTAVSNFRKEKRKPGFKSVTNTELEFADEMEVPFHIPKSELLMTAIEELNRMDKAIILLYLEDKSYSEMSSIMGWTKTNVGVRLKRAKEKLSVIIKKLTNEFRRL